MEARGRAYSAYLDRGQIGEIRSGGGGGWRMVGRGDFVVPSLAGVLILLTLGKILISCLSGR